MRKTIPFFLFLLLVTACDNKLYDIEDGLNGEMTLFEEEISVPVGNAGPFTMDLLMQDKKIGALLGDALTTEEDGTIFCRLEEPIFKMSAYEIIAKTKDMSKPFSYPVENKSYAPATLANLLQSFGFASVDQKLNIFVNNPLSATYTLGGSLRVACQNSKTFTWVYDQSFPLADITVNRSGSDTRLLSLEIPDTVQCTPSTVELKDWCFNFPANMDKELYSNSRTEFIFTSQFFCHIAAGKNAEIPLAMFGMSKQTFKFNLPLASYKLKEVEVSLVLENTLPLQVTLADIKLMIGKETLTENENLLVTPETIVIKGGSPETPGITPITLNIKALEGSIPDISGVYVDLAIKSEPDFAETLLSLKQGVSVRSASATLRGGITLGGNE